MLLAALGIGAMSLPPPTPSLPGFALKSGTAWRAIVATTFGGISPLAHIAQRRRSRSMVLN
jgi:hypothetical protein